MKAPEPKRLLLFLTLITGLVAALILVRSDVNVDDAVAADPDGSPLALRIWWPKRMPAEAQLPLVVISHGTGGSNAGHSDTALALARAGFVVVAVTHTGDNFRNMSQVKAGIHLSGRPRHITRTIDYMFDDWPQRALLDPARIGMVGHSAGGFTALVVAGAEPDLSRRANYCREQPDAWTCRYLRKHGYRTDDLGKQRPMAWVSDPRVKALVIAAPAIGYSFDAAALANIKIPVQLWAAEYDVIVDDGPQLIAEALPVLPELHQVAGAGHFSFFDPCDVPTRAIIAAMELFGTEAICTDPVGFDRARFHARLNDSIAEFFTDNL